MATFINYGGNYLPRQPGRSNHAKVFFFGLRADEAAIQALCDRTLNLKDSQGNSPHPDLEYRAIGPMVFFLFMKMDHIGSLHPQDCMKGLLRENELNIAIPLLVFEREFGIMVPRRLVWYMPYLWIDSGVAMASGRETYGFPKTMATLEVPGDLGDQAVFTVHAETWDPFNPYTQTLIRQIVDVRRIDGEDIESETELGELKDFIGDLLKVWSLPLITKPFVTLSSMLPGARFVFLKQFRDHRNGDDACYQTIVEAPVKYPVFRGGHWLAGDYRVQIFSYASAPVIHELGLAGANGTGDVARQTPLYSAMLDFDFVLEDGETMWTAP